MSSEANETQMGRLRQFDENKIQTKSPVLRPVASVLSGVLKNMTVDEVKYGKWKNYCKTMSCIQYTVEWPLFCAIPDRLATPIRAATITVQRSAKIEIPSAKISITSPRPSYGRYLNHNNSSPTREQLSKKKFQSTKSTVKIMEKVYPRGNRSGNL